MSLKQQPGYRYSWAKPWAFDDYHAMRKGITEHEIYKKVKLLERHSWLKKPYFNLKSHPHGELVFSVPDIPPWGVDPFPPWRPGDGLPPPVYEPGCPVACLPTHLNCDGGCSVITCICGSTASVSSINDPTGGLVSVGPGVTAKSDSYVGTTGFSLLSGTHFDICLESGYTPDEEFPVVIVTIKSSDGSQSHIEIPIVGCDTCCVEPTISGSATATTNSTVDFTVSPPCPNATPACAGDCTDITVSLNNDGSKITATLGANACGTFYVTLTEQDGCPAWTASSNECRVTDNGDWDTGNVTICDVTNGVCGPGACNVQDINQTILCGVDCYKYTVWCRPSSTCSNAVSSCKPPCVTSHGNCFGDPECYWFHEKVEWTCAGAGGGGWC
jgi:hypothetical protein